MSNAPITWMRTRELAIHLGVHHNTRGNMLQQGLLRDGIYRHKINPLAPLCHLIDTNHSKGFWALVSRYDTAYKENKKWLKQCALALL